MLKNLLLICGLLTGIPATAQLIDRYAFGDVDTYVSHLGPMRELRLKEIVDTLSKPCQDQACVVRAIYDWVCREIEFDCRAARHPKQQNASPSITLRDRTATAEGYAVLFQTMCGLAHIPCNTVSGMAKQFPMQIGKANAADLHYWNTVLIRDRWYVCDLTWGAGTTDERVREFKKRFTDAWFLSDRHNFALCHYPDDRKQQLLDTPLAKPEFTLSPTVGPAAMIYRIHTASLMRGQLRGRQDDTGKILIFEVPRPEPIKVVTAVAEDGTPVPVHWSLSGHQLQVAFIYPEKGTYPVYLLVNSEYAFGFAATVSERKIKRPPATPHKG